MSAEVSLPQMARAAKVEYRTLKVWAERGMFGEIEWNGTGHPIRLDARMADVAKHLGRLRRRGLSIAGLEDVASELRRRDEATCPVCRNRMCLLDSKDSGGGR